MPKPLATWTVGLVIVVFALGVSGPVPAAEDPFAAMAVQRPPKADPAPGLALPDLDGRTVHLKDLRGRAVLLGFFTTT